MSDKAPSDAKIGGLQRKQSSAASMMKEKDLGILME